MSVNVVAISGNLTRDPELRSTASGMAVMGFGVAVNDRRKNQQTGEWEDYPNFVDCTMFGSRAESLSKYLSKGTKVFIEGKLRWSQWEKNGEKRSKLEVVVDEIEFHTKERRNEPQMQGGFYEAPKAAPQPSWQPSPVPVFEEVTEPSIYDEDIPF